MDNSNRREFSRESIPVRVRVQLDSGDEILGRARDLSANGFFVETAGSADAGSEGEIEISFGDRGGAMQVHARGRVVRATADGLAVSMTEVDLDSYHHLRNLITYNAHDTDRVLGEFESHLGLKRVPVSPSESPPSGS
ncbi:MAG: PilZ domain-containing protein [Myxococcales bacterium]|nr:PilZ domain-containing protein [Myxococcales bacterium]